MGFVVIVVKTHFLGLPLSLSLPHIFCHFLFLLFVVDFVFPALARKRTKKNETNAGVCGVGRKKTQGIHCRPEFPTDFVSSLSLVLGSTELTSGTGPPCFSRALDWTAVASVRAEHDHGR